MLSPILACSDVEAAIQYYTQKLSFAHAWSMPPNEQGKTEFACVKLGDAEILIGITEGFVAPADLAKRGIGIQLYIQLSDSTPIDQVYNTAVAQGAAIVRPLQNRDWGDRAFTVNDADGYQLMIAQAVRKGA
jgi:PhnB protein